MTALPSGLVTFLMTDVEGSTELLRRVGQQRFAALIGAHRELLGATVREHRGCEVDCQADSTFSVFVRPSDAVRAAAEAQHALAAAEWPDDEPLRVRMGIHTGEAAPDGGSYHGLAVHRTARICAEAVGGQVLVSQPTVSVLADTHEQLTGLDLADCGERRLKDFELPVRLYEVVAGGSEATARRRIGVLIVDDQALVRTGFRMILEAEPDLEVVGEAADGEEAIDLTRRLEPDVVLMDVRMPKLDGIEATRRLLSADAIGSKIVMLTTFDMDEYVYEALRVGASGFLLKDVPPEQLIVGIRSVASGDALLAPSITRRVIEEFVRRPPEAALKQSRELEELTPRELEMLRYLARGLSNAEIAKAAFVSETTVKTHVARILMKLRLRDRVQAVVFAYEHGIVAPGES
jgi:DNA-binding NarL/FixJ family response regulator